MCAVDDKRPARRSSSSSGSSSNVFIITAAEGSPGYRGKKRERIHQHRPSMATQTTASCTGSTLLQPISEIINLPLDQVCFRMEYNPCLICAFCGKRHSIIFKTELACLHKTLAEARNAPRYSSQTLALAFMPFRIAEMVCTLSVLAFGSRHQARR